MCLTYGRFKISIRKQKIIYVRKSKDLLENKIVESLLDSSVYSMLKCFRITVNIVIFNSQVNMLNKVCVNFSPIQLWVLALLTTVNIALPSVSLAQKQPKLPLLQPISPITKPVSPTPRLATDYFLGGGDLIRVNVFEVPEYTGEYQIPPRWFN